MKVRILKLVLRGLAPVLALGLSGTVAAGGPLPQGYVEKLALETPESPTTVEFINSRSGGHTKALFLNRSAGNLREFTIEEIKKLGCKTAKLDVRKAGEGNTMISECWFSDRYETVDITISREGDSRIFYFIKNTRVKDRDIPVLRELSREKLRETLPKENPMPEAPAPDNASEGQTAAR